MNNIIDKKYLDNDAISVKLIESLFNKLDDFNIMFLELSRNNNDSNNFIYDILVISKLYATVYYLYKYYFDKKCNNKYDKFKTFLKNVKIQLLTNKTNENHKSYIDDNNIYIYDLFSIDTLNLKDIVYIDNYYKVYNIDKEYYNTKNIPILLYHALDNNTLKGLKGLSDFITNQNNNINKITNSNTSDNKVSYGTENIDSTDINITFTKNNILEDNNIIKLYEEYNSIYKDKYNYTRILLYLQAFNNIKNSNEIYILKILQYNIHYYNALIFNINIEYLILSINLSINKCKKKLQVILNNIYTDITKCNLSNILYDIKNILFNNGRAYFIDYIHIIPEFHKYLDGTIKPTKYFGTSFTYENTYSVSGSYKQIKRRNTDGTFTYSFEYEKVLVPPKNLSFSNNCSIINGKILPEKSNIFSDYNGIYTIDAYTQYILDNYDIKLNEVIDIISKLKYKGNFLWDNFLEHIAYLLYYVEIIHKYDYHNEYAKYYDRTIPDENYDVLEKIALLSKDIELALFYCSRTNDDEYFNTYTSKAIKTAVNNISDFLIKDIRKLYKYISKKITYSITTNIDINIIITNINTIEPDIQKNITTDYEYCINNYNKIINNYKLDIMRDKGVKFENKIFKINTNDVNNELVKLNTTINKYNNELKNYSNIIWYYRKIIIFGFILLAIIIIIFNLNIIDNYIKSLIYLFILLIIILYFKNNIIQEKFTSGSSVENENKNENEYLKNKYKSSLNDYQYYIQYLVYTDIMEPTIIDKIDKLDILNQNKIEFYKIKKMSLESSIDLFAKSLNSYYFHTVSIIFNIFIIIISAILYLLIPDILLYIIIFIIISFIASIYYIQYNIHKTTRMNEDKYYWAYLNPPKLLLDLL